MSATTNTAFEAAHDALFDVFGEAAQVRRNRGARVPVRVVVTYGVAELGDYGQGLARITTATFLNRAWRPRAGDMLELLSGVHRIDRIVSDDGLVTEVVLHG
jgi:hypothetical protein